MYVGRRRDELAPHVFAVADESYRCLLNDRKSQSMLVTGESGAGKTENTKKIIQYLAAIAGKSGSEGQLEKQLLQCNPLLEALGNAKTNKNNNSSRFGKFIKITFGNNSFISGGSVVSYLLEKSRVVHQGNNERSFHIFYQMCEGLPNDQKLEYHLSQPDDYKYLNHSGCTRVEGMDDGREFEDTVEALRVLDFTTDEKITLFKVIAGVLQLGNVEFKGDEVATVVNPEFLKYAAELWDVEPAALEAGIIRPKISVGRGELIAKALSPIKAASNRDALSKAIYNRLFLWVVDKINQTLKVKKDDLFIGILDIAGFEYNSFEQLCIHFTNERLQQFFHLEQEEYRREKIGGK
jgi:myosin heavy subunit